MAAPTTLEPICAGFRGNLEEVQLPSLLSILEMERKTGFLDLSLDGGKSRLHLRKGRVLRAHRVGAEGPRDAELVYGLIAASRGTFDFRPSTVALGDKIRRSTAQLLIDGLRRQNESAPEHEPSRLRISMKAAVAALMTVAFVLALIAGVRCSGSPDHAPAADRWSR